MQRMNGVHLLLLLCFVSINFEATAFSFIRPRSGAPGRGFTTSHRFSRGFLLFNSQRAFPPSSLRHRLLVASDGAPRLASAYGQLLALSLRIFAGGGFVEGANVQCKAASNRAVLAGEIDHLRIAFDRLRGPLFHISKGACVEGANLRIGAARPSLLLLSPLLLPAVAVSVLQWSGILLGVATVPLAMLLTLALIVSAPTPQTTKGDSGGRRSNTENSFVKYSLCLSSRDIAKSRLLRRLLQAVVGDLLRTSLVGQALSAAAAASVGAAATQGTSASSSSSSNLFFGSRPRDRGAVFGGALGEEALPRKLAQATRFRVKGVGVALDEEGTRRSGAGSEGANLVLDAEASFPDEAASQLAFTLRCRVKPGVVVNPERSGVAPGTTRPDNNAAPPLLAAATEAAAAAAAAAAASPTPAAALSASRGQDQKLATQQRGGGGVSGGGNVSSPRKQQHALEFCDPAVRADFDGVSLFGWQPSPMWVPVLAGSCALPLGRWHCLEAVQAKPSQGGGGGDDDGGGNAVHLFGKVYFNGDAPVRRADAAWDPGKWWRGER